MLFILRICESTVESSLGKTEVFDGALFHVHKMSITKSEAKKLISQFLQKEVK